MEGLHPALSSPGNLPCLQQILNDWLQALVLTKTNKYIVREKQIAEKENSTGPRWLHRPGRCLREADFGEIWRVSKILLTRGRRQQKGTAGRGSCLCKVLKERQSRTGQSCTETQVAGVLGTQGDEAQAAARGIASLVFISRAGDTDDPGREEFGTILVGKMEVGSTSLAT